MCDQMQEKLHAVRVILAVLSVVISAVVSGCAGGQERDGGELVEVTEEKVTEDKPKEEAKETIETKETKGTKDAGDSGAEGGKIRESVPEETGTIYVHVCGEVASPGVYELPAGSRLYEAVVAAGGLLDSAAGERLNQAAEAGVGQQIYVPSREEAALGLTDDPASLGNMPEGMAEDGRISLNTASKEQLMTLSGIGEAKAASIISYREEHGGFQRIEELMEVEGIKEGVFNKVKDQIKI